MEEERNFKSHFVLATLSDDLFTTQEKSKPMAPVKNPAKRNARSSSDTVTKYARIENGEKVLGIRTAIPSNAPLNDLTRTQTNGHGINRQSDELEPRLGLDDQYSPEIPLQNHQPLDETNNNQKPNQNESFYQGIKQLFFEPTQNCDDQSLVVLAPDSDDDCS